MEQSVTVVLVVPDTAQRRPPSATAPRDAVIQASGVRRGLGAGSPELIACKYCLVIC